jgi:hypothetical protein
MDEQKITKESRTVRLTLSDETTVEGEIFLNLFEAHTGRPERVGTLLNREIVFLPVKTVEGVFLVNLQQVVTVQVAAAEEQDELMLLGQQHTVRIHTTTGQELIADIYVDLPQTSSRTKDYVNQPHRFFRLFRDDEITYINPDYILYLRD